MVPTNTPTTVGKHDRALYGSVPARSNPCRCKRTHPHDGRTIGACVEHDVVGHLHGVKIAPCRACGRVRQVQVATGLCGNGSCLRMRKVRHEARRARRLVK